MGLCNHHAAVNAMEPASTRILERFVEAILSPWSWSLFLAYLVFLGNGRMKVHGILDSLWDGAQAWTRIADRMGSMEKKLDKIIELQSAPDPEPDSTIRISLPK